jgi:fatty-acyl-CoA synthase
VVVIEQMPMTNVGKIYKPELRALAARRVAEALVEEAWADLDLPGAARPTVQAEGESALRIVIDAQAAGTAAEALHERLAQSIGRLPIKAQVVLQ